MSKFYFLYPGKNCIRSVVVKFYVPFFLKNDLTPSQTLDPVSFIFELHPFERSQTPVDTNFQPDNLVLLPVIRSSSVRAMVGVNNYILSVCGVTMAV